MTSAPIIDEEAFFLEQKGRNWKSVSVKLSPAHNRKPFPNDESDENIERLWKEKREKNPNMRLFNAMKFRLHGSSSTENSLTLHLGISDYKSHVGTNLRPVFEQSRASECYYYSPQNQKDEDPFLAHCLGVAACVVSADDMAVMFKRSQHVAQHAGFASFPGGHPEPFRFFRKLAELLELDKKKKSSESTTTIGDVDVDVDAEKESTSHLSTLLVNPLLTNEKIDETVPVRELRNLFDEILLEIITNAQDHEEFQSLVQKALVDELFFSIREEVHGELGVPLELVEVELILGLVRATAVTTKGKPDLCFMVRVNCSFEEIKSKYFVHRTGEDAFEAEEGSLIGLKLALDKAENKNCDLEEGNQESVAVALSKKELLQSFKNTVRLTAPCLASLMLAIEAM